MIDIPIYGIHPHCDVPLGVGRREEAVDIWEECSPQGPPTPPLVSTAAPLLVVRVPPRLGVDVTIMKEQ